MLQRRWILLGLVALLFVAKRAVEHRSTLGMAEAHGSENGRAIAPAIVSVARSDRTGTTASTGRIVEDARLSNVVKGSVAVELSAESAAISAEVAQLQQLAQD